MGDRRQRRYYRSSDAYEGRAESRYGDEGRSSYSREDLFRYDRSRYGSRAAQDERAFDDDLTYNERSYADARDDAADWDEYDAPSTTRRRLVSRYDDDDDYGSGDDEGLRAGRRPYYDNFYDEMRIPEEDGYDEGRTRSARASYSRNNRESYSSRRASGGYGGREVQAAPKRSKKKIVIVALCVVLALGLIGAGIAYAYMHRITETLNEGVDDELLNALVETDMAKEPFYMLLLGTDGSAARDNDPEIAGSYRSDSMILARIDVPNKKVTMVSISRDIMVDLGEYGVQKINAAYGLGGPALSVKAVSDLAGVDISHYAQVDFDGFSELVDAMGGVEVEVPVEIDDWEAGGYVPAGLQTLNGAQALTLCRSRNTYMNSAHPDEMRAANQRLVISAIAKKLLASDIVTIANSVQALAQFVTTDLKLNDIIGLAQGMQGIDPSTDIYTAQVPTTSEYVNETWIENVNQKEWKEMMARIDAGEPPVDETVVDAETGTVVATAGKAADKSKNRTSTITVKNGSDIQGVASKTRTQLMDAGWNTVIISDAVAGYDYPLTLVVYNKDSDAAEADEIVQAMGQGTAFKNDGSYLLSDTDFLVVIGDDYVVKN